MSGRSIRFTFENRQIECAEGTSVAAAVIARGTTILTRSFKYHRARGYTCGYGVCPNCPLTIDGVPGVTSCTTPAADGMVVRRERGWPSASWDVFATSTLFARFLSAGFQFRHFARHPKVAHRFENVMALVAGAGRMPTAQAADRLTARVHGSQIMCDPDVVVVGGGLSGCQAAISAAHAGARVVLVNDGQLGGRSLAGRKRTTVDAEGNERRVDVLAHELARVVRTMEPDLTVVDGTAIGWFEGGVLPVAGGAVSCRLRPTNLIVATGSYEIADLYAGNDLPGTMLRGAVERLLYRDQVRPGTRAVIVTDNDDGLAFADELVEAGIPVQLVVDKRADSTEERHPRHRVVTAARIVRARGRRAVRAVEVRRGDGTITRHACDLVVHALGERPAEELRTQWLSQHDGAAAGMWAVGSAAVGERGALSALQHAAHVGRVAATTASASRRSHDGQEPSDV